MKLKIIALVFILMSYSVLCPAVQEQPGQESDQQISDFSLVGYGERGKKTWDLSGKSADIFDEVVKLKDIVGNMYNEKENVKLTADTGDFKKTDNSVHLEKNVVLTTSSGAKLTTNSLDWDRKNNLIYTKDQVNIQRDAMITTAVGARAEPGLSQVKLEKDVNVQMMPPGNGAQTKAGATNKVVITCDSSLDIDYAKNIATFNDNVKVDREGSQIYADKMDVYFISDKGKTPKETDKSGMGLGGKIDKIIARGNVKIVRGENISYSDEAIYSASENKITLTGKPRIVIESPEDFKNAPVGN